MRAAPAVQLAIGPDRAWSAVARAIAAAALAGLAAWAAAWAQAAPAMAAACAALAGVAGAALAPWGSPAARGHLRWDGRAWSWQPLAGPARDGDLRAACDLGPWLLLRFDAFGAPRQRVWLPLARSAAGAAWHGLRTAVYSRRPDPSLPPRGAEPE